MGAQRPLRYVKLPVSLLGEKVLAKPEEGMGEVARNTRVVTKQNRARQKPRIGHLLGKASVGN